METPTQTHESISLGPKDGSGWLEFYFKFRTRSQSNMTS